MRLPKNIKNEKTEQRDSKSPKSPQPVGGNALERLHQFEQERGLPKTEVNNPDHDNSKENAERKD
jgi:hypothetical protein